MQHFFKTLFHFNPTLAWGWTGCVWLDPQTVSWQTQVDQSKHGCCRSLHWGPSWLWTDPTTREETLVESNNILSGCNSSPDWNWSDSLKWTLWVWAHPAVLWRRATLLRSSRSWCSLVTGWRRTLPLWRRVPGPRSTDLREDGDKINTL